MKMKLSSFVIMILLATIIGRYGSSLPVHAEHENALTHNTETNKLEVVRSPITAAVCDPGKVFSEYNKATELAAGLEVEIKDAKEIVQDMAKKIDIKQKYLAGLKKRSKEYEKGFEELATIKAEYRAYVKTVTANLNERKAVLITSGLADVYSAIDEVAKANGIDIVLAKKTSGEDRRTVLYADKVLDITDEVIAMVNGEVVAE